MFVVDETGFIKKGVRSAGVQRQYTGTTGKIDNCQLGVFLAYASGQGSGVDRPGAVPAHRAGPRTADRCARAGVPDEVGFATKPQLGLAMLARAHAAGVLAGWVTADEAYGQNPTFRAWLAEREVPFVLATRNDDVLVSPDGHRRQAKVLATARPARGDGGGWERRSIGPGAHGERIYDWTAVALDPAGLPDGWGHWLLVRRQTEPGPGKKYRELAFYRCAAPAQTPLRELIRVAGARWAIEECFQTAKNEAGLDQYQVRDWRAWYAHITLAMLAAAYLAATRAHREAEKGDLQTGRDGLIPLSGNEIRRLLAALVLTPVACLTSAITLVELAPTPTTPSPHLPLPTPRHSTHHPDTECRCSTRSVSWANGTSTDNPGRWS